VNIHKDRENNIVGGHKRVEIMQGMGEKYMPCVEVDLNEELEKELNIRLNKNQGSWDSERLLEFFDEQELSDYGFSKGEMDEIHKELKKSQKVLETDFEDDPRYPIVQKYDEKYKAVIIVCENETDFLSLSEKLQLSKMQDYKSPDVKKTSVLSYNEFAEIWNAK